MTREQAQVYAKISREELKIINEGYDKHYDELCAYAAGAEIEFFNGLGKWVSIKEPSFNKDEAYYVKPSAEQPAKPWKPKFGDEYFLITFDGKIKTTKWFYPPTDEMIFNFGNCFKTYEEAEEARERVRAALKGEAPAATEKVESLDGHELSDAEKGVIRILRRCKVETMWNGPFVYLEGQKTLSTCNAGVLFKFESGAKASEFGDLADDVIAEAEERREKGEPSW